jgi:hypothetical protein
MVPSSSHIVRIRRSGRAAINDDHRAQAAGFEPTLSRQ